MQIPLEFYEQLRSKIRISDVIRKKISLTKKSGEYLGLCPFHNEKSPSFTVNDIKRFYHCFGCSAHGDVVRFVANINGFSYKDAAIRLAGDYSIELPKLSKEQELLYQETDAIYAILQKGLVFFKSALTLKAIDYLKSRGINENLIKEFDIGFAPGGGKLIEFFKNNNIPTAKLVKSGLVSAKAENNLSEMFNNRIIFPIKNTYGKVTGFGGRVLDNSLPKYLNSPETMVFKKNEILYGEDKAISAAYKKNYIILVEGYLDVISLSAAGFPETVASLGTAVTINHIQKLWQYCDEIILCLDADNAGVNAKKRVINIALPLINYQKKLSCIMLPIGSDPHDLITKQGSEIFTALLQSRISLSMMIWKMEYRHNSLKTAEEQALLQAKLDNYCGQITDKNLAYSYKKFFKDQIWNHLFKGKKMVSPSNTSELLKDNFNEAELIEHALCLMLIKFPQIIRHEHIKDFFQSTNFINENFANFKWWLLEQLSYDTNSEVKNLEEKIKRTEFYETYNLLLNFNNILNDKLLNKSADGVLLFEILQKKYYLILLKTESATITANNIKEPFEKIKRYREEIISVMSELETLMESFANN